MVGGFKTTDAISVYHHKSCEFKFRSWRCVRYRTLCFVSDLRYVGDFLRVLWCPPPIKLTAPIYLKYC